MLTYVESDTTGRCAQRLIAALQSSSRERIGCALDCIANLHSHSARDARELEFRDLLAAIAQSLTKTAPMQGPARRAIALRMLAHVAAAAG
jgi:hypothetical protein